MKALAFAAIAAFAATPIETQALFSALRGPWTGYLEYKDYAGPGRVRIAVLFRFTPAPDGKTATLRFVFDEGPGKTMEDVQSVTLDPDRKTYTMKSADSEQTYRIEGLEKLRKDGTGVVYIYGSGTSNDKPVEVRMTLTIERNKLRMLRETRPTANVPYVFGSVFELVAVRQPS